MDDGGRRGRRAPAAQKQIDPAEAILKVMTREQLRAGIARRLFSTEQMQQAISYLNQPELAAAIILQRKEEEDAALALSLSAETGTNEGPRIEELEGACIVQVADAAAHRTMKMHHIKLAHVTNTLSPSKKAKTASVGGAGAAANSVPNTPGGARRSSASAAAAGASAAGAGATNNGGDEPSEEEVVTALMEMYATPLPVPVMFASEH